jgi:AsmA protein
VFGLLAVWLLVNPNDYTARVAAAVKHDTGRELKLEGPLRLSVFPWIALQMGPGSLGNPPGFSDQPFLSFAHASLRVRLLPLVFARRLEVGRVQIDGLNLTLARNAAGRGNWQGFGHAQRPTPATPAAAPPDGTSLSEIAGIKLARARVTYQDLVIENIDVETGTFAAHGVVPVSFHFEASHGTGSRKTSIDGRFDFSAGSEAQHYAVQALDVNGASSRQGDPRAVHGALAAAAIDVNLADQSLTVPAYAVNIAGAHFGGRLEGRNLTDDPIFAGTVMLEPLVVREYLPQLGLTGPVTRDPKVWALVSGSSNFTVGGNAARLDVLQVTLDDTTVTGSVALVNVATNTLAFELTVDDIDLDRYLPPASTDVPAPGTNAPPTPQPAAPSPKPMEASGTLTVGRLHLGPLDLSDVNITVAAHDGLMRLFPLTAEVDSGRYSGDITLDRRGATPVLSLDEHLSGIDVSRLFTTQTKDLRVSGRGSLDLKATGSGEGSNAILKSLEGHFEANVSTGALEGIDLGYELARAAAVLSRDADPPPINADRTSFDTLKVSAQIAHGIATTHDLLVSSSALKVTGEGTANLATQALDLKLTADTMKTLAGTPLQIPVLVRGTFANPDVRPDVEALAKGQLREKVKDLLKDKLKSLFGQP